MKKSFLWAVIIASIVTLSSCEKHNVNGLPPDNAVTLMKFKDPSYVNNLIVNEYDAGFLLMRGNKCSAGYLFNTYGNAWNYGFEPLDERIPYIELTDGWYLIDWSWYGYPYNGKALLTEVTWDNYKGEYSFDKSTPHISGNIFEKRDVNFMDLVAYSYPDGNYPLYTFHYPNSSYVEEVNEYLYFSYLIGGPYAGPHINFLSSNGDCLCNRVEEMDALWNLIRSQLNTLIQNGDLSSLPHASEAQKLELLHEIIKTE